MKFTTLTRGIGALNMPAGLRSSLNLACLKGTPLDSVTVIAERLAKKAGHGVTILDKTWEFARDKRRNAKRHNTQVYEARATVRAIFESTAAAIGSNLSATKHALETRHPLNVMRPFVLSVTDITEEGIAMLKAEDVQLTVIKGKLHQLKAVEVPFNELEKCLYEQARQFYMKKRETG